MFEAVEKIIENEFPIAELVQLLEALPDVVRRRVEAAEDKAAADVKTVAAWAEKNLAELRAETETALDGKVKAALDKALGSIDLSAAKAELAKLVPAETKPEGTPPAPEGGQSVEVEHA